MEQFFGQASRRAGIVLSVVLGVLGSRVPALAALGQPLASVEDDRAQMEGTRSEAQAPDYVVHRIQAPTGTIVEEWVSQDGTVFAVSWHGPFVPNLHQLLGAYYPALADEIKREPARPRRRGAVLVQRDDLVIETGGHMRAFVGRAYIPSRLPQSLRQGGLP